VWQKEQEHAQGDSSDSDSEDSEDEISADEPDSDDNDLDLNDLIKTSRDEAAQRAKTERRAKKRAEKPRSQELAKRGKMKEVRLNGMTSLTGRQDVVKSCYRCGGPHLRAQCTQNPKKRRNQGGDDGPQRKPRKPN